MKLRVYLWLLIFCFTVVFPVSGKKTEYILDKKNRILFYNIQAVMEGDSLLVSFDLKFKGKIVPSDYGLHITPIYETNKKNLYFPKIVINSKRRAPYYRRDLRFKSEDEMRTQLPYASLIQRGGKNAYQLHYEVRHNIQHLQKDGKLYLEQVFKNCCNAFVVASDTIIIHYRETIKQKQKINKREQLKEEAIIEEKKQCVEASDFFIKDIRQNSNVKVVLVDCSFKDIYSLLRASSEALIWGDLDAAWECLSHLLDKPEAYNNLGIYYWMRGELKSARTYLEKALDIDPTTAKYNLQLFNNRDIVHKKPKVTRGE